MTVKVQEFGTEISGLSGDELIPMVVDDGSGNFTDHRAPASEIADLASSTQTVLTLNNLGTYDNAATYNQNDAVRYENGGIFGTYFHYNATPSTGVLPTDVTKWAVIALDGEDGEDGDPGVNGTAVGSQCTFTTGTVDANGKIGGTTTLSIHQNDRNGNALPLTNIVSGSVILVQDESNAANYSTYTLTADLVLGGSVYTAASTVVSGGAIADATQVRIQIERKGSGTTGGAGFVRQEATPAANADAIWIKPSTAQWFFYDPNSTAWIEK